MNSNVGLKLINIKTAKVPNVPEMDMPRFLNGLAPFLKWTCPIPKMEIPRSQNGHALFLNGHAPFPKWACPIR
jgi:hypothetical protein